MNQFHAGNDVYDKGRSWKFRVLLASFPCDPEGAIVRAVLGRNMIRGLCYGLTAVIDREGIVRSNVRAHDGETYARMAVGSVIAVRDCFRRIADHCKLDDDERLAFFDELRKWVIKDERSESDLDIARHN